MTALQRTPRRGDAAPLARLHGATARSRGGGDHAALLALQRSAGNAAVARIATQAAARDAAGMPATPHTPLLQRKVGFEAELMVPSIGPAHGKLTFAKHDSRVSPAIKSFLDGGVPYGTKISTKGGPIRIDSDHSKDISREPIVEILRKAGYVKGKPKEPRTRLEFVTKAVDELAPGSDAELTALKTTLEQQLSQALSHAKSRKLVQLDPPAKKGYYTGVPETDFRRWLQTDYGLVEKALVEFRDKKIADEVYLQATVGIIPSAIRRFMHSAGSASRGAVLEPPGQGRKHLIRIVTDEVDALEREDWFAQDAWVRGLDAISREAVMGMVWLTYSYLLGDTLQRTSAGTKSTAKNAVPFLIKHGPFRLLGDAGTTELHDDPLPLKLGRKIAAWCAKRRYLKRSYWIGTDGDSALGQGLVTKQIRARKPKDEVIEGKHADFVLKMLTKRGGNPVKTFSGGLPDLDSLPEDSGGVDVYDASYSQEAIPLEYRWISKRYKVSEVADAIDAIVGTVRLANVQDLSIDDQVAVLDSF